jgi:YidC/Oxa1 family membrane protein insertase
MILFVILSFAMMWGMQFVLDRLGLLPARKPPVAAAKEDEEKVDQAKNEPAKVEKAEGAKPDVAAVPPPAEAKAAAEAKAPAVTAPKIKLVEAEKLVLGSATDKTPDGYKLQVKLDQKGAGVASVISSRIEAEFEDNQPRNRPLNLIKEDLTVPPSFSLGLSLPEKKLANDEGNADSPTSRVEYALDATPWEVVPDAQGNVVREVPNGQAIRFRTTVGSPPVIVTKTFSLQKGQDGFEMDIGFESPDKDRTVVYRLAGPHGIPIEGEWYTGTFRDVFFGRVQGSGVKIDTLPAYDVVKNKEEPERFRSLPLKYTGVENQYFAVFLTPKLDVKKIDQTWEEEAYPSVIHQTEEKQKSDVTVQVLSKPIVIGPNQSKLLSYRIFAGPKTTDALTPFGATELTAYRKGWSLGPLGDLGASYVSTNFISPMLSYIYKFTKYVAGFFGGKNGNYGVAIILLTMTVRLILFPLGRKQAAAAKKMQDLTPHMAAIKEKYKDDKEKVTKETWALYKQHGVNPMGGCLPALIQLPILIGLWQTLNNSVALRHSSFLWIKNLAAPDMLFKFPFAIPLVGQWLGPYFNILPLVVVGLMMVQTKLFSPPAVTEEAKMQQSTMKFMMIFMMFMFYKVPSGLGIYFITSSLWQICERLLLPKPAPAAQVVLEDSSDRETEAGKDRTSPGSGGRGGSSGRGGANGDAPRGFWSEAKERLAQVIEEASKDRTHRNTDDRDRDRDRDRGKPRPRPPGRKR